MKKIIVLVLLFAASCGITYSQSCDGGVQLNAGQHVKIGRCLAANGHQELAIEHFHIAIDLTEYYIDSFEALSEVIIASDCRELAYTDLRLYRKTLAVLKQEPDFQDEYKRLLHAKESICKHYNLR